MDYKKTAKIFKVNQKPLIITPTQENIMEIIAERKHKRVITILPTQYGKSLIVALAVLLRVVSLPEKWIIAAPSDKKAKIIMGYLIDHLFDSPIFYTQLEIDNSERFERIKRERSKNRLTFKRGGEVLT